MYERSAEYFIKIIDNVLPNIEGKNDNIRSQLPQHPKGTREKNEKNELIAVPQVPAPKIPFFLSILQPSPLL